MAHLTIRNSENIHFPLPFGHTLCFFMLKKVFFNAHLNELERNRLIGDRCKSYMRVVCLRIF